MQSDLNLIPPATSAARRHGFPFKRFLKDAPYAMALSVVGALVVTFVLGARYLMENLVISMCIGTIAFVLIDGLRLSIWGENKRMQWLPFIGILLVSVPAAQFGGSRLAGLILGFELVELQTVGSEHSTSMLMFTLLTTACGIVFFANRDRRIRAEADAALERARAEAVTRQALQAQLQLLQAQVEPHMLFNTLANLQGLIAIDPERAQRMLDQLIHYLRATLSSSRAEATTLAQEFALMEAYLGLMAVRMGRRLAFSVQLPDALRGAVVPPMLLQPLVENAIIHGLEPKIDGGHVTVSAALDDGMLALEVADTGLGLDAVPARPGTRVGLANTRRRLLALYGEGATLTLEAGAPHGAVARLILPLETS